MFCFALVIKEGAQGIFLLMNRIKIVVILTSLTVLITSIFYFIPQYFISLSILLFSAFSLIGCYYGFSGVFGQVLGISKLRYLGKISYGLYLFHKPIPYFIKLICSTLNLEINNSILFIVSILVTVFIAHLSYKYLEKRFLALKEKFDL